jgi:hypothetical protein
MKASAEEQVFFQEKDLAILLALCLSNFFIPVFGCSFVLPILKNLPTYLKIGRENDVILRKKIGKKVEKIRK